MTEYENSNGSDDMGAMSIEEKEAMATLLEENPDDCIMEEGDSDECEIANLIRIRENIFETEDDEDSDYDFPMPEVEIHNSPTHSRKRKQVINLRGEGDVSLDMKNRSIEFVEIDDESEQDQDQSIGDGNGNSAEKRNRLPLYLLNPDEYGHDPKKQAQIRRAIITYRHHQEKKTQIIKLTEENVKLRAHNESLKLKLLEVSSCGCDKNSNVNLDVLDVIIPEVPPRMYVRGNKTVLAAPYHKMSFPPADLLQQDPSIFTNTVNIKTDPDAASSPQVMTTKKIHTNTVMTRSKSLGNNVVISQTQGLKTVSMPMTSINCKALFTANGVKIQSLANGSIAKMQNGSVRVVTAVTPARNQVVMSAIKTEPGTSTPARTIRMPPPPPLIQVGSLASTSTKNVSNSPATATPISRIVFANKATSSSNAVQTASQLVFGTRTTQPPQTRPLVRPSVPGLIAAPTASQMAMMGNNRLRLASPTTTTTATKLNFLGSGTGGTLFRTATGQILRMVKPTPTTASSQVKVVQPQPKQVVPQFKPIKPKPTPDPVETIEIEKDSIIKEMEKREFEELWRKFARDTGELSSDDDEPQVVSSITEVSPPSTGRNRKQNLTRESNGDNAPAIKKQVIVAGDSVVELNKYADIVFEEC